MSNKNLTVLIVQKRSKEAYDRFCVGVEYLQFSITKVELNFYLDIITHLNIATHLNITVHLNITEHLKIVGYISKSVKLKNRDGDRKRQKKRYKAIFSSFLFLAFRLD